MRTKLNGLLTLLLAFVVHVSFAQDKTITGTVTDADGLPLPGVNIVVEGTTTGTQTDFDGNYSISASQGQALLFSYIGQRDARRTVDASNVIDVQMEEDTQALEEVVVTALGIKREKQALGYAVTEVGSEDLEQRPDGDVARVLQGKAAGVQITNQSGLSGSGTNVIIRGLSTFSSSNQALFIVDGVPFSTDTNSVGRQGDRQDFVNGNNGSSRFLDLDPNSIESVNVLRGLAAATLYGSQGRNGVILITTKGGSTGAAGPKKTEVTVNSSVFFNEIASLPDYQNEYGNGFDQSFGWFFSNWGPSFRRDGASGWGNQSAIDDQGTLAHPYSTSTAAIQAAFPEFQGARYDWRPYDSVGRFFKQGLITNTSVNVRGASDDGKIGFNVNYGYLKDNGFTPNNSVTRNTLSVGGRAQLSNKFTAAGTLNFSRTKFVSPPVALSQGNGSTGTGSSVFGHLWFTPRSIDVQGLPFQNPIDGSSVYYRQNNSIQHPLWTVANAESNQQTNRVFGQASIQYDINDNLNLVYRAGIDIYSENNTNFQNRGGIGGGARTVSGFYETWNNTNTIWDHNFILNGDFDINEKIGSTFNVGATSRREVFDQNGVASDGQQVFGVLRHFNYLNQNEIQLFAERNLVGVYGQVDFDYDKYLYLTLAGRNDWVSNFSSDNRTQFYPSASISFIPTAAIDGLKSENVLNYLKIRAGIGVSANFESSAYPVASTLFLDTQDAQDSSGANIVSNEIGTRTGNPNLKPETLQEIEVGIESRWWDGRITLDASVYKRNTNDLILDKPLDPAAFGTIITAINIGEIESEGIEADLGVNWFRAKDEGGFSWSTNLNFTAYETTVLDLGEDFGPDDSIVYSGFSNLGNAAIEGEPLGVFFGDRIARDANGNSIVGADGNYVTDPNDGIIGDPNPDWVANVRNTISYKNFTLGFQWNYTQGGDVYSSTISTLMGRGLITETIDREDTYILPGVDSNGNVNNLQINNSTFWFSNILFGPSELQVYDATTVRLQEASLSYSLPKKFLDKTPFGNLTFTVSGNNLWYRAVNTPKGANFDPNTSGLGVSNGFGFDFINGPSARRYGLSVKATF